MPDYFAKSLDNDDQHLQLTGEGRSAEWDRAYGSIERVYWVREQPSIVSGDRPCVNAHVISGGMGRKADAKWIVPLTDAEHHELHDHGSETFEQKYGVNLIDAAIATDTRWQTYLTLHPRLPW